MATLAGKRKSIIRSLWSGLLSYLRFMARFFGWLFLKFYPRGADKILYWFGGKLYSILFIVVFGGLVVSATGVVSYLAYSGYFTHALAGLLVQACSSAGNCTDFSALLAGTAVGVMILVVITLAILAGINIRSADLAIETPSADDTSQAMLLLNWYCLSAQSRVLMLDIFDRVSEADVSEDVMRMLRDEHKAMQEVMHGGS